MANIRFDQGYVSARGRESLQPGELTKALGVYYKRGDNRAWKIPGRAAFADTGSAAKIKGLALAKFDNGTDYLLALSGTTLYKATAGTTGTFTSAATGLSSSSDRLESAHMNDRWYLADGADAMRVISNTGTVRTAGMVTPDAAPGVTVANLSYAYERGTVSSNTNFVNTGNAVDADSNTSSAGTADAEMIIDGFTTATGTGRSVSVSYSVDAPSYQCRVVVGLSENGTDYTTISTYLFDAAAANVLVSAAIDDATTITDVKIKITLTDIAEGSDDGGESYPGTGGPFRETF